MPDRYLGRQIGKYRVIRLLGAGAFAWVYEAIDRDLEIPVALKILRPEFAGNTDAEARFRREATTAARLRHPNIVTVRDVGTSDDAVYVAMDLHPLSLARRLALVTRLPEPETVRIGLDVAAALAIAHAGGIIHRDIKPDNILIGPNGEAVVADFGLARALSSDASTSATNQVMGTPHYFSPEQARGAEIDGRSDLYSLGVTLFRTITGRLPFEGDDWYAVAKQHVETPPPRPSDLVPDIGPAFDAILQRLLAKNPEERFESAVQLADALALLPTAPVQRGGAMTPHSASQTVVDFAPPVPAARRRRPVAVVGAIALAAVLVWGASQRGLLGALGGPFATATTPPDTAGMVGSDENNSVPPDSAARDTLKLGTGGIVPPSPTILPGDASTSAVTRPQRPAQPARVPVSLAAPESAALYVNGERVGFGSWSGDLLPAARYVFRATIADAPPECRTASREEARRVSAGQSLDLTFDVRSCTGVQLNVQPSNAIVTFDPLDGGQRWEGRADVTPTFSIPVGRYRVSATSPRCSPYNADQQVQRQASGGPWVLRVLLICP